MRAGDVPPRLLCTLRSDGNHALHSIAFAFDRSADGPAAFDQAVSLSEIVLPAAVTPCPAWFFA